ncbi:MAG: cation transporter [Chloroflexi bacterium]|nr:cation transporter [Chloroflexota bacterium]
MRIVTYSVPAIHCGHCVQTIEMEVGEMTGVEAVKADLSDHRVMVRFDDPATEESIKALLTEINYPAVA